MRQIQIIRVEGGRPEDVTSIGAIAFTKGRSQYLSDSDAEIHANGIETIDANAGVTVAEGEERPPFLQKYTVKLIDPDAERDARHAEAEAQAATSAGFDEDEE